MKPYRHIYEKVCDFENIYEAYKKASLSKRFKYEVLAFSADLEENLHNIKQELLSGEYRIGGYREFYVYEPKRRLIMAIPFKDGVVQWAAYRIVNPLLAKGYIADSFACIDGRGIHGAAKRIQYWANLLTRDEGAKAYYLKLDISKYFYRVDHGVLLDILRRKFDDPPLIALFEKIIRNDTVAFGLPPGANPGGGQGRIFDRGMPIGNLTSQMFANLYLNELDQYVKREPGIKYYCRYMDDTVILSHDKAILNEYRKKIEAFLNDKLKLSLNDKTALRPLDEGIDFCGYRIWGSHIKLRKSSALKMKHRLKKLMSDYESGKVDIEDVKRTLASYKGVLQHCDSYALRRAIYGVYPEGDWNEGWFVLRRNSEAIQLNSATQTIPTEDG
jgi:retron-type reverse transcriptase